METKKDEVNLFINGIECFRITNNNIYYAYDPEDEDNFEEVSKEEFKKRLLGCNWILDSWDKKFAEQYKEMLKMVS